MGFAVGGAAAPRGPARLAGAGRLPPRLRADGRLPAGPRAPALGPARRPGRPASPHDAPPQWDPAWAGEVLVLLAGRRLRGALAARRRPCLGHEELAGGRAPQMAPPWRRAPRAVRRICRAISSTARRCAGDAEQPPVRSEPQRSTRLRLPKVAIRILSGLVLGEIMGCATFAGGWAFVLAYGAAVYLISREYANIVNQVLEPPLVPALQWSLFCVSSCTLLAAHFSVLTGIFECAACSMLVLLLLWQGNTKRPDGGVSITFSHIASQVFGVFYVGYLPAFWVRMRSIGLALPSEPASWLVWLLRLLHWPLEKSVGTCATVSLVLCIIAADSCAYFGGKKWGRRPLTLVSPNKTLEGAYFGLAGSVAMALLCDATWGFPANPAVSVALGVTIFLSSLLGDLVVSAMKRDAGLKDAGSLIPGHGGILDRFDSYFFACPMAYFCWYMFLKATGNPLTPLIVPAGS